MNHSTVISRNAIVPRLAIVPVLCFGLLAGTASAGTDTANLTVSANVIDNCLISTTDLAFVDYDPIDSNASAGVNLDGTGSISVTCTLDDVVQIELNGGANELGGPIVADPARRMLKGVDDFLAYFIYSDVAHTTKWATGAAVDVESTGTGAAVSHTVYGQVTKGQNVPFGNYSDTVVATVTF